MKKRICENCTQKETCHLLLSIAEDGQLYRFFAVGPYDRVGKSDLALACKFYEEDND